MTFRTIGVSRHRLGSDGVGVTTLVGGCGCPLDCAYCLNPHCKTAGTRTSDYSVSELYEKLRIDSLYFAATGGGVTFGGGEPLLQAEFIREFILYCKSRGEEWHFSIETSLAVDNPALGELDGLIDEYIVDVKDMDPDIYRSYTGASIEALMQNLSYLAKLCPERVLIKLPLIPGFNTATDIERSAAALEELGYTRFMRFRYITKIKKQIR